MMVWGGRWGCKVSGGQKHQRIHFFPVLCRICLWVVTETGCFSEYSVLMHPDAVQGAVGGKVRLERECILIHSESEAISAHFV